MIAALLHGTAFLLYNIQATKGESSPRAASWGVWALLAVTNAFSYKEMTADWYSALQFFMGSVGCIATFLYVWWIGSLGRPKGREWTDFAIGVTATILLVLFQASDWASLIIIVGFLFSFRPTYTLVRDDPTKEKALPWTIWAIAFGITIVNKTLGPANPDATLLGTFLGLAVPAVLFFTHAQIAVLSRRSRQEQYLCV